MRDAPREIAFARHDGRRGLDWLRMSYALFRRKPVPWLLLVLAYYFVLLAIKMVPFAGGLAAVVMKPVFAVGFLAAAWNQERGTAPSPRHLFQGFHSNLGALIPLGLVLLAGIALAFGATALVDGGRLLGLFIDPAPADLDQEAAAQRFADTLGDARVQLAMVFGALCALPTILALWWAPALVVFQDAGVAVALRTSLRACIANWRALLRYSVSVFFFTVIVPSLLSWLIPLLFPQSLYALAAALILLPYTACFVATLQISDYVSYRDVFHGSETVGSADKDLGRPGGAR
jgi:hypothetical protein